MRPRLPSSTALRAFEAAARHLSFKEAAHELSVTPTAVSHQIRALEAELGFALFERLPRAVSLTESGGRLFESVHAAFQQIALTLEEVSSLESVLSVDTTPAFAAMWLVPRLARFQESHPHIQINLTTGIERRDLKRNRQVDIAIRYGRGPFDGLHAVQLTDESFGAYGSPEYLRATERFEDLTLFATGWKFSGFDDLCWDNWLTEAGLSSEVTAKPHVFDHQHFVVQAGLASQGLILSSSLLVKDFVQRGWLEAYRPHVQIKGRAYTAVCLPAVASLSKTTQFLQWLIEEASTASQL